MSTDVTGTVFGSSLPAASFGGAVGSAVGVSSLGSGTVGQVAALPRAGVGGFEDNASVNFLLFGSIMTALYLAVVFLVRRAAGKRVAVEDDGITGM
jgi:hypothetical protein